MSTSNEAPEIEDDEGPWDERVARTIILAPFIMLFVAVLTVAGLVATGVIGVNVTIEGSVAASTIFNRVLAPLSLLFGGLLGLTWLLALMKEYGVNPVMWVVQRIANLARDYNPNQEN